MYRNDLFLDMSWSDYAAVYEGGLTEALSNDFDLTRLNPASPAQE